MGAWVLINDRWYKFELRAITENGQRLRERRNVVVRRGDVAQGETYYEHDGGVVQLVQSGGAFEGIMRAPTVDQALAGYDIGQVFVRGAYANRAYTALRPLNYDDPNSERRRYYEDHAVQVAAGSYKVLSPNCPPQWGDYGFNVSFDPENGQASSISGTVVYKGFMTRAERAYARARQPMPRAGITGRLIWVSEMMSMMRRFGDNSGRPDECVTSDAPEKSRPATFTRISAERAQEIGRENVNNTRDFAQRAYDGLDGPPPDDGTPRMTDPTYGEAPSSQDPVYLASGEFYETSIDLTDATIGGQGWRFQRTYRSQSPVHTSMGHGWVHNYQLALVRDSDGWRYRNENGGHEYFQPLSPGLFQSARASRLKVTADARIIRMQDGTLYTFAPTTGLPDQSRLEHIVSPGGARLSFSYDLAGRIVQVRNSAGNAARYSYDDDRGYLIRVEAPDDSAVAFAYDADGNLTSKSDLHPVSGDVISQTHYAYRGSGDNIAPELLHNMVQIWLPGGGQRPALDIAYGEDTDSAGFDRVIEQRTGTLVEHFAYGRTDAAGGELFTTRLTAEGRADEVHFFTAQGRHERTIYVTADLQEIATDLLYDVEGKPAGRRYPSGAALEFTPGPARALVVQTRTPAAGSDLPHVHWVTATEPVFGLQKAIFGPFVGAAPTTLAEIEKKRRVTRIYDYEEAGSAASQYLIDFGLVADGPALGDVNADGTTDQAAGRLVQEIKNSGDHETEITTYIWNDDGSLSRILRADGSATRFEFSDTGLLVQVAVTNPQGAETIEAVYDWDASGGLIGAQIGNTGYIGIERDALGRIVKTTQADGQIRSLLYDNVGRIRAEVLGEKKVAEFAYDDFGRLVELRRWATEDDFIVETYAYDAFGRVISATDPAGTWSRDLDPFGRTLREIMPNGEALSFDYDTEGRLIEESGLGWMHQHSYDGHGRHIETVTQSGDVISFRYDDGSRPIARTVMRDGKLIDRILLERDGTGELTGISGFAADDQQIALPLGEDNVSVGVPGPDLFSGSLQRDLMGRITGFRSNDGATWKSHWDSASRLTSISRDGIEVFSMNFQDDRRSLAVRMFGFAALHVSVDELTTTRIDGRGAETSSVRDGYGRLLAENAELNGQTARRSFAYDGVGRMVMHQRDGTVWTRTFDGIAPVEDNLRFADGTSFAIARHHDHLGRLTKRILPSGQAIEFSYPDAASAEISVGDNLISLDYSPDGAIQRATLGAATVGYSLPILDARGSEFRVVASGRDGELLDREIRFENGRAAAISEPLLGGLTAVVRGDNGRIITVGSESFLYSVSGAMKAGDGDIPHLPAHASDPALAVLDPDGRVAQVNGRTIRRDPFGLISGTERGGSTSRYLRDGQGRVVTIIANGVRSDVVYDGGTVTGLYRDSARIYEYVLDANNVPVALITDDGVHLLALDFGGGALAAIGADGVIAMRVKLSAYGVPGFSQGVSTDPQPLLDGMLYDPNSGLYLTAARAMDPEIGQFLSPEPFGPLASPLPYEYAAGDPFTYRDATGALPSGTGGVEPDPSIGQKFGEAVREPWNKAGEALDDNLGPGSDGGSSGRESENGSGSPSGSGSQSGGGSDGAGGRSQRYPGINSGGRDYEAEERAAERRANIAAIDARIRARESAFKRNTRFADKLLPEEVQRLWLNEDAEFINSYHTIYKGERVPWGTPATGPSVANPGDPHALLRATLRGRNANQGRTGDRLRFLFRNQLSVPPPVAPPATRINAPPRAAPPGRQPTGISSIGGGSRQPSTAPAQPTPATRKKPTGLSNIGALF